MNVTPSISYLWEKARQKFTASPRNISKFAALYGRS